VKILLVAINPKAYWTKPVEHAEKLKTIPYIGNMTFRTDKFGMLVEVLKIREKKKKLTDSCTETYNSPTGILT